MSPIFVTWYEKTATPIHIIVATYVSSRLAKSVSIVRFPIA